MSSQVSSKPNIIFITVDDLNDYVEGYDGHPQILTPNLNLLKSKGYLFYNTYCNAPVCGPSRTSFLSGKDVAYTQVYNNDDYNEEFRDNFADSLGNEEVITLPEHLKNVGGYYTIGINKIFHKPSNRDYDNTVYDPCLKALSWSKVSSFNDFEYIQTLVETYNTGLQECNWGILPDSLESQLKDYRTVDTAINFLNKIISGEITLCDSAFFMAIGFDAPHLDLYFPEKYFPPYFLKDFYSEPFNFPYNLPADTFPYNGIKMPPQPAIRWDDFYHLGPLGQNITESQGDIEDSFNDYVDTITELPVINADYTDSLRREIYKEAMRANAMIAYMAGIQYMDAQLGRLMEYLESKPEILNNTIIILIGDNGFSFGEKHHWMKRTLWEPDVRVPFILVDPHRDSNIVCNQEVSLLDIFPTVCELTGTPMPVFADSTAYLDGKSIVPILNNPGLTWEHPTLITFSAEDNKECSCSPQIAVRTAKYKYIRYTSDGGDPSTECIPALSFVEEELYDIGVNREIDPYEWNNLIDNSDYQPLVNYLQQWMPDSGMYLKNAFQLEIHEVPEPCLYVYDDSIVLNFNLLDTLGNISEAPIGYSFFWTNNLSDDTLWGENVTFYFNLLSPGSFAASNHIVIYANMMENTTGAISAFDLTSFLINPETAPSVTFEIDQTDDFTFEINNVNIIGDYYSIKWDFGDGFVSSEISPEPHTYTSAGGYFITCYLTFGNDSVCENEFQQYIYLFNSDDFGNETLNLFPNPTNDLLNADLGEFAGNGVINITDYTGRVVFTDETTNADYPYYVVSTSKLASGVYILTHRCQGNTKTGIFMVAK